MRNLIVQQRSLRKLWFVKHLLKEYIEDTLHLDLILRCSFELSGEGIFFESTQYDE